MQVILRKTFTRQLKAGWGFGIHVRVCSLWCVLGPETQNLASISFLIHMDSDCPPTENVHTLTDRGLDGMRSKVRRPFTDENGWYP